MNIPLRRDPSGADRLNDLLDAMRSGTRAPDASADEATDLARTARQFRRLADRAASIDPAPATTFDAIWEDMMSAHTLAPPLPADTGPATPITPETHRVPTVPGMPEHGRWQSLLSAAIVVVVLAGLVATAWNLRGTGNGTSGPEDSARLAATAMQDGTPEASPAAPSTDWTEWISIDECTLEPLDADDIDEIRADTEGYPVPRYGQVSEPSTSDAESVAHAARILTACNIPEGDDPLGYGTASYIWRYTSPHSPQSEPQAALDFREDNGRQVSADLAHITLTDVLRPGSDSWDAQSTFPMSFLPEHAVQFPDGRIGILATFYTVPPTAPDLPDRFYTTFMVFSDESGTWLMDDWLPICLGECSDYLNGGAWGENPAEATPEPTMSSRVIPLPGTPIASPATTPNNASSGDWTAWVTPQECTAEPMSQDEYASILSEAPDVSGRSYTLVGPADPEAARDAIEAARANRACIEYGMENERRGTETDASIFYRNPNANQPISATEYSEQQSNRGKELSAQMEYLTEEDFYLITTTEPPEELLAKWSSNSIDPSPVVGSVSYNPDNAFTLEDGRIVIPDTSLWWYADPAMADEPPSDGYVSGTVVILLEEGGGWKVDESLRVCVGDCDAFWNGIIGAFTPPTSTPIASPVATPQR